MGLSGDALAAWVAASCERQGVPVRVTDAGIVSRLVVLLDGGPPAQRAKRAADGPPPSELPDDLDPAGVKTASSGGAGSDNHSVHDGVDDGGLAGEVEGFPLGA